METTPPQHHRNTTKFPPHVKVDERQLPDGLSINRMLVQGDVEGIDILLHGNKQVDLKPRIPRQPRPMPQPVPLPEEPEETPEDNGLRIISEQHIRYQGEQVIYHAKGRLSHDQTTMQVLLILEDKVYGRKHRHRIDLYDQKNVRQVCCELADAEGYDGRDMQREIATFTDLLEAHRDRIMTPAANKKEAPSRTNTAMIQQAHNILRQPDLLNTLDQLIGQAGVVGEEKTRLPMLVMASTYKMDHPLHLLIQGATGSGKSHLLNTIAECCPPEDVLSMTRVTSRSFYHYGDGELISKLVLIQDYDGLDDEAQYAFREM